MFYVFVLNETYVLDHALAYSLSCETFLQIRPIAAGTLLDLPRNHQAKPGIARSKPRKRVNDELRPLVRCYLPEEQQGLVVGPKPESCSGFDPTQPHLRKCHVDP